MNLNSDTCYWLGVTGFARLSKNTLIFNRQEADPIAAKLHAFFGESARFRVTKHQLHEVTFISRGLVAELRKLGILPGLTLDPRLTGSADFWRGWIYCQGRIYYNKSPHFRIRFNSLNASKARQFQAWVRQETGLELGSWVDGKGKKQDSMIRLAANGSSAKKLVEVIYRGQEHDELITKILAWEPSPTFKTPRHRLFQRLPIDERAFDSPLSDAAAYWLGYLMADGMMSDGGTVRLSSIDHEHIAKFQAFMKTELKISRRQTVTNFGPCDLSALSFKNAALSARLRELGLIPRKTGKESVPAEVRLNPHFWRGLVDGDGTVGLYLNHGLKKYPLVKLGSSMEVAEGLVAYAEGLGIGRPQIKAGSSLHSCAWNSNPAKDLVLALYPPGLDPAIALDRKHQVAREIHAWEGRRLKAWSLDRCLEHAQKFVSYTAWVADRSSYNIASTRGWLEQVKREIFPGQCFYNHRPGALQARQVLAPALHGSMP